MGGGKLSEEKTAGKVKNRIHQKKKKDRGRGTPKKQGGENGEGQRQWKLISRQVAGRFPGKKMEKEKTKKVWIKQGKKEKECAASRKNWQKKRNQGRGGFKGDIRAKASKNQKERKQSPKGERASRCRRETGGKVHIQTTAIAPHLG